MALSTLDSSSSAWPPAPHFPGQRTPMSFPFLEWPLVIVCYTDRIRHISAKILRYCPPTSALQRRDAVLPGLTLSNSVGASPGFPSRSGPGMVRPPASTRDTSMQIFNGPLWMSDSGKGASPPGLTQPPWHRGLSVG